MVGTLSRTSIKSQFTYFMQKWEALILRTSPRFSDFSRRLKREKSHSTLVDNIMLTALRTIKIPRPVTQSASTTSFVLEESITRALPNSYLARLSLGSQVYLSLAFWAKDCHPVKVLPAACSHYIFSYFRVIVAAFFLAMFVFAACTVSFRMDLSLGLRLFPLSQGRGLEVETGSCSFSWWPISRCSSAGLEDSVWVPVDGVSWVTQSEGDVHLSTSLLLHFDAYHTRVTWVLQRLSVIVYLIYAVDGLIILGVACETV